MLSTSLKERLADLDGLPTLPFFIQRLLNTIEQDKFTAQDLEIVIRQDPALSSRLLKVANSSFFGQSEQVGTLKRAIVLLGTQFIQALAVSVSIIDVIAYNREVGKVPWEDYWLHSFACGWVCHNLVKRGVFFEVGDEAFLSGLLHDLGKPVLWIYAARPYQEVIRRIREENLEITSAETATLGCHHGEVGGELARWWHFPQGIRGAIQEHHAAKPKTPAARLVQAAHFVSHSAKFSDGLLSEASILSMKVEIWKDAKPATLAEVGKELLAREHEIQDLVGLLCVADGGFGATWDKATSPENPDSEHATDPKP